MSGPATDENHMNIPNEDYDDNEIYSDSADEWDAPVMELPGVEDEAQRRSQQLREEMDHIERELQGEEVPVTFLLPDGKQVSRTYYMGQTVEYLKMQLEEMDNLSYEKTVLFLGDRQLLDPLSLNDLPFKPKENNEVVVKLV